MSKVLSFDDDVVSCRADILGAPMGCSSTSCSSSPPQQRPPVAGRLDRLLVRLEATHPFPEQFLPESLSYAHPPSQAGLNDLRDSYTHGWSSRRVRLVCTKGTDTHQLAA